MWRFLLFAQLVSLSNADHDRDLNVYCCDEVCQCPVGNLCDPRQPTCRVVEGTSLTANCWQGICGPCPPPDPETGATPMCFCAPGPIGQPKCKRPIPPCTRNIQ